MRSRTPPPAPTTGGTGAPVSAASSSVSEAICPSSSVITRTFSPNASALRAAIMMSWLPDASPRSESTVSALSALRPSVGSSRKRTRLLRASAQASAPRRRSSPESRFGYTSAALSRPSRASPSRAFSRASRREKPASSAARSAFSEIVRSSKRSASSAAAHSRRQAARRDSLHRAVFSPPTSISPRDGISRMASRCSSAVFPLPDAPVSTTRPVSGSVRFKQRSACTLFFPAEDSSAAFFSWIIERPILSY